MIYLSSISKFFLFPLIAVLLSFYLKSPAFSQSCSPTPPDTQCSVSTSVNITAMVAESSVTFTGFGPIQGLITFKESDVVIGTVVVGSSGGFSKTITTSPGTHNFTLYATDNKGLSTPEVAVNNVNVSHHSDTLVPNLLLPPTITITQTKIVDGQKISFSGQGPPGSNLTVVLNGKNILTLPIGSVGTWVYELSKGYIIGQNSLYVFLSRNSTDDSKPSKIINFEVEACTVENECPQPPTERPEQPPGEKDEIIRRNYHIDFNLGFDLGKGLALFLLTALFTSALLLIFLLLLFLLWKRRDRKKEEEVFEELGKKVERDLKLDNPELRVEKDFWEAEKKLQQ